MTKWYIVICNYEFGTVPVAIFDTKVKADVYIDNIVPENERQYHWIQEMAVDVEALNGRD